MIYKNPIERIYKAGIYSINGLYAAIKDEQAFRHELIIFLGVCLICLLFKFELSRKIILICGWLVVMAFELINSAVERAFNLIDKKYNPEIKAGKDMLSAAIFLMISANIILWLFIICEKFFNLFFNS